MLGKRFIFAIVAIICCSVVSVLLKYDGDLFFKLVLAICGVFTAGQTITDIKKTK